MKGKGTFTHVLSELRLFHTTITTLYCASHHTTSHHTTPHHTTPHHTIPHHITPHHITPNHITLHHTTPHFPWIELRNVGIQYCTNPAIVGRIETLPTSWNCPCMYDHWRVSNSIVLLLCVRMLFSPKACPSSLLVPLFYALPCHDRYTSHHTMTHLTTHSPNLSNCVHTWHHFPQHQRTWQ